MDVTGMYLTPCSNDLLLYVFRRRIGMLYSKKMRAHMIICEKFKFAPFLWIKGGGNKTFGELKWVSRNVGGAFWMP